MKYIRTYESFKDKSRQSVNEEFLGSLFKKFKNSLSMGFSKMFGSAAKVDKIIDDYEKELKVKLAPSIKAYSEFISISKESKDLSGKNVTQLREIAKEMGIEGLSKLNKKDLIGAIQSKEKEPKEQALNNIKKQSDIYQKEKDLIKQKFNLKIKDAIEDENNKKIKNYVTLKKLELEQKLIQYEVKEITSQTGLTEEELGNIKVYSEILNKNKKRIVDLNGLIKKQGDEISKEKEEEKTDIKEGDTVEYTSEKDKDKKFTNKVKSVSDDEVEIETKNGGNIRRRIVDVKKVQGQENPDIKEGDTVEYKSENDENKTFTNKVKSVSDDEVEIETKNSGIIRRKISDVKKVLSENE